MSDSTAFVQERMRISTWFFLFEYIALKFCWWSWRKTASELYDWHFLSEMAHTSVNYNELWMLQQFLRFLPPNKIFHSYFPNQKNLWYFQTPDKHSWHNAVESGLTVDNRSIADILVAWCLCVALHVGITVTRMDAQNVKIGIAFWFFGVDCRYTDFDWLIHSLFWQIVTTHKV